MRRYAILIFCLFTQVLPAVAQKTCAISVSSYKGCIPHPVTFDVTATGGTPTKYEWDFGDNTGTGTTKNIGHAYIKRGTYSVSVKVTFSDGTTCTETLPKPVRILDNPFVDFNMKNNAVIILCHPGEKVCFRDLSSPGADGAPIENWVWDFGEGGLSTDRHPCYIYTKSGTYVVSLEARDTNGCKKLVQKTLQVKFATDLNLVPKVKFKAGIKYYCDQEKAEVTFTNQTDTAGFGITKFTWDFGDGSKKSCDLAIPSCRAEWLSIKHDYTKSGTYKPTLSVETKNGCVASYSIDTPIVLEPYKLAILISPSGALCHGKDSVIQFQTTPHSKASYYIWDYGDPYDTDVGRLPWSQHTYKYPGTYTIRLRVKVYDCVYDTTFCHKVTLKGPRAKILRAPFEYEPWDSIPREGTGIIPESQYRYYFDTSCYAPSHVPYYTYDTITIKNGDTTFTYCGSPVSGYAYDTLVDECTQDTIVKTTSVRKPKVASVKDKDSIAATLRIWANGNPWPKKPVYSDLPFKNDPLKMDDTALFSLRCGPPQLITFTNFSTKFRGYDAVDNVPPGFPDTCINPAYPFASDSLRYEWDFGEGDPVTSTSQNRNERARFSTEKLPTHLYKQAGCYWVKLRAYDPVTNCFHEDEVPVIVEAPDAGWDPVHGSRMNWVKQQNIPPSSRHRGMQVVGLPCGGALQGIEFAETKPLCYKRDFAFIPDSAAMSWRPACDTSKVLHQWLSKDDIKKMGYRFEYNDTGWKSIGVVVTNNYACTDTVWYHNYKYVHGIYPGLSIDKKQVCAGGKVSLSPIIKEQPGMKLFHLQYIVESDKGNVLKTIRDTFRFRVIDTQKDTATSTVHEPDWGIDDPSGLDFNYLRDTLSMVIDTPGHVTVKSYAINRFGCIDSSQIEFTVGHHAELFAPQRNLCLGDTAKFQSYIRYYLPFSVNGSGFDATNYWADPQGFRNGRVPLISEKVEWDFDGDGVTDAANTEPAFIYKKPGVYTVKLTTTDSSGCTQVIVMKDYIRVVGIHASFGIDSPGTLRYCAPHFYQFRDSSFVVDTAKINFIQSWTWDFGDGTPPLEVTDPKRKDAAHLYLENGEFTVTLTIKTYDGSGANDSGCTETYSRKIRIVGPHADFVPISGLEGCVPLTVAVIDRSGKTALHEWKLGDGTQMSSSGEDTVFLTYTKPGIFCPQLIIADTIVDLLGNVLYCSDSSEYCKYKVIVHDTSRIDIRLSDTVVCVNEELLGVNGLIDTGYTSWKAEYGDGASDTFKKPYFTHIYKDTGRFVIRMTGKNGTCPDTGYAMVRVIDVLADFYLDTLANDTPYFSFVNTSRGAVKYKWEFDDGSPPVETTEKSVLRHEFRRPGKVQICLTAYNKKGCYRKVCQELGLITDLHIPNVFTPGSPDGKNDRFVIDIKGETKYELMIYNRWGELVFRSDNKDMTWDGTDIRSGRVLPTGTYYFVFRYRHIGGQDKEAHGTVTLLR